MFFLWNCIREHYNEALPSIISNYPRYDPYTFDWEPYQTPIERNVWGQIRELGLPIKCMQFPVKQYFIDFADPVKKIGIEVDGKVWHQNYRKDRIRQEEIEAFGWILYRIEGRQTFSEIEKYESEKEYFADSSEGILYQIRDAHYQDIYKHKGKFTRLGDMTDKWFKTEVCHR